MIENKTFKAIDVIADTLPIKNSMNLISSGGVFNKIEETENIINERIGTLQEEVGTHTEQIGLINEQINNAFERIEENTADITALDTEKADISDVYTKQETYTKTEVDDLISGISGSSTKSFFINQPTTELTSDTVTLELPIRTSDLQHGEVISVFFQNNISSSQKIGTLYLNIINATPKSIRVMREGRLENFTSHHLLSGNFNSRYPYRMFNDDICLRLAYLDQYWLICEDNTIISYLDSSVNSVCYTVSAFGDIKQWGSRTSTNNIITIQLGVEMSNTNYYASSVVNANTTNAIPFRSGAFDKTKTNFKTWPANAPSNFLIVGF